LVKKIAKIGPVDPEIIGLREIIKTIGKIEAYSPVGKFAEQAKLLIIFGAIIIFFNFKAKPAGYF